MTVKLESTEGASLSRCSGNLARAHLDVADGQRRVQHRKGEEGAKVLAGQHRVEAHHRDGRCTKGVLQRIRNAKPFGLP